MAELRQKEAECFDKLAQVVPDMQDNEVVILAEKVKGSELPQCVHQMSQRIDNPRDFHAALAVGERLYSLYKYNQAGMPLHRYRTSAYILTSARPKCMNCCEEVNTNMPPKRKEKLKRNH